MRLLLPPKKSDIDMCGVAWWCVVVCPVSFISWGQIRKPLVLLGGPALVTWLPMSVTTSERQRQTYPPFSIC